MHLPALLAGDFALFASDIAIAYDSVASVAAGAGEALRRSRQAIDVQVLEGGGAVSRCAPAWRAIEAAGGAATPFQLLALAEGAAAVHERRGETPRIIVVHEGNRPVVIFPTVITRLAGCPVVRFLGDPLIQYGDILASPEAEPRHIEAAWRAAADHRVAGAVLLRRVRADAWIAPTLARHTRTVAEAGAPYIDLQRQLPLRTRDAKDLRRFRRRLSERGPVRFELLRGDAAQPALRQALSFKREWLASRGLESLVIGNPDWEDMLATLAGTHRGAGLLSAAHLTIGDQTAAIEIGFIQGRRWCAFLGAINPEFAKAGPGHVQMEETIAHCKAAGLALYDLLAPTDQYKCRIATDIVPVRDYAAALGASGRLAVLAANAAPRIKALVNSLPGPLRRVAQSAIGRLLQPRR